MFLNVWSFTWYIFVNRTHLLADYNLKCPMECSQWASLSQTRNEKLQCINLRNGSCIIDRVNTWKGACIQPCDQYCTAMSSDSWFSNNCCSWLPGYIALASASGACGSKVSFTLRERESEFFLWSLLLLNVNIKLDSLWTNLEAMSLSLPYVGNTKGPVEYNFAFDQTIYV